MLALPITQTLECVVDLGARAGARGDVLLLDLQVDLLAEDRDVPRSLDADTDLLAHDRQHGDLYVIADHDRLVGLACQYQHDAASLAISDSVHRTDPHLSVRRALVRLLGVGVVGYGACTRRSPWIVGPYALLSGPPMSRRSLRPQLNQIRGWVRQGRTDAWIAHQLEVTVQQIQAFKREQGLEPDVDDNGGAVEEVDLRAEDDAQIAAELEEEAARRAEEERL